MNAQVVGFRGEKLRVRVYKELLERLQRGEIQARDRLIDLTLAATLGVSRMPVREALLQLTTEGYLVSTSRGFMVATLTHAEVADVFEIRRLLEPRAAANAAQDLSVPALEALGAAVAAARAAFVARDVAEMGHANSDFRNAWLSCVRNRRLADTIARFADHVQIVRYGTLTNFEIQQVVVDGLQHLLDAFSRRDPGAVQRRMADFLARAEDSYFAERDKEVTGL